MRIKRGVAAHKRHKKVLKQTKGMSHSRRASYRLGKQAVIRSLQYAYRDRRNKKRDFRALWITRINAAARQHGLSYSEFISKVKAHNVELNRKVLAELAVKYPEVFDDIVKEVTPK